MTSPEAAFAALHRAVVESCGARLFTVSVLDRAAGVARRAYTSHPDAYPVTGAKPMGQTGWSAQVIGEGRAFVANTTAEFAVHFSDHALINALGCHSAMNIPVSNGVQVVGTVNILDAEGHFTPDRIATLQALVDARCANLLAAMVAHVDGAPHMARTQTRMQRLQARMRAQGVDLLALAPGAHMRWLLGFAPHPDERACVLLIGPEDAGFVMPALNAMDARQHTDLPFWEWPDAGDPGSALTAALLAICPDPARLALDEAMRADHAMMLVDALPGAARGFAADTLGALRMIKDAAELACIAANARTADAAQSAVRAAIRPGVTERELAEVARASFEAQGARAQFTILAAAANSAFPHHHTGDAAVQANSVVLADIGGQMDGYFSDITRMATVGAPPEGYAVVHAIVDAAVQAALAAVRPGVTAQTVDEAARGVIVQAGYGDHFTHRTGHGLGTEVHEPPYMVGGNRLTLEEGMVFTIEPGIYLPGRFGVRLEEVAVVTQDGARIFSSLSRDAFAA